MSVLYGGLGVTAGEVRAELRAARDAAPDGQRVDELAAGVVVGVGVRRRGADPWPAWGRDRRWWAFVTHPPSNLRALREELLARGMVDAAAGPSAVAAALAAEAGPARVLDRLEGDAVVAIWDAAAQELWVARDRAGHRRVYLRGGVVSTEPPRGPADVEGLAALVDDELVAPPKTPVAGVAALAPGELVVLSGAPTRRTWWTHGQNPRGAGGAAYRWARSVELATRLAVQLRLPAEGAVAVAGTGVFAQAVRAVAAERPRRAAPLVLAFGEGAPGATPVTLPADDLDLAAEECARAGLFHPEALAWWALARAAWAHDCAVLLTGVGGAASHTAPVRPLPLRLAGRLRGRSFGEEDAASLAHERRVRLPERDLATLDRVGLLHQVDVLAPLADPRLQALIAEVPIEHLRDRGAPRALFCAAFPNVSGAPAPLDVPLARWLADPAVVPRLDALPDVLGALLDPAHVRQVVTLAREGNPSLQRRAWRLLALGRWASSAAEGVGPRGEASAVG